MICVLCHLFTVKEICCKMKFVAYHICKPASGITIVINLQGFKMEKIFTRKHAHVTSIREKKGEKERKLSYVFVTQKKKTVQPMKEIKWFARHFQALLIVNIWLPIYVMVTSQKCVMFLKQILCRDQSSPNAQSLLPMGVCCWSVLHFPSTCFWLLNEEWRQQQHPRTPGVACIPLIG